MRGYLKHVLVSILMVMTVALAAAAARADFAFGPQQVVQASGADIDVGTYSVPCYGDWNSDGAGDLIIGRGDGQVSVYLNTGTAQAPAFSPGSSFQVMAGGVMLEVGSSGCMGSFPRLVHWNDDSLVDLLVSDTYGKVSVCLNQGPADSPVFAYGTYLQVGQPGSKSDIDVGDRAAACVTDWNGDGCKDLVLGELTGLVNILLNEGTDTAPDFRSMTLLQDAVTSTDLEVPSQRSSPTMGDLDGDGLMDLVAGNTNGELLLYINVGTANAPQFSAYTDLEADGVKIDLSGSARSRPFLCDWTGDGLLDLLVGASDGKVYLYEGVPEPATLALLVMGGAAVLARRRRRR